VRRKLTAEGYIIIANIGDQDSDLTGGYAERIFKLPNPFYLTK
jgi:HAD superfamily, subfamily IIIB (Acid phosphatase)